MSNLNQMSLNECRDRAAEADEARCATCACFCSPNRDDDIDSDVGTCISRRYPSLGRKPVRRASDPACGAYQYWARPEKTGSAA